MATTQTDPPKLNHAAPGWFHDAWESLRDWLKAHRVVQGPGILISDAPGGGLLIQAKGSGGRAGGGGGPINFELIDASSGGAPRIRIRQGIVSSDGKTFIPTGMFPGDSTPYTTAVTANGEAWLNVLVDAEGNTTGVTLGVGSSTPASESGVGRKTLGSYGTEAGVFTVTGAIGDQEHLANGGAHYFWS